MKLDIEIESVFHICNQPENILQDVLCSLVDKGFLKVYKDENSFRSAFRNLHGYLFMRRFRLNLFYSMLFYFGVEEQRYYGVG